LMPISCFIYTCAPKLFESNIMSSLSKPWVFV